MGTRCFSFDEPACRGAYKYFQFNRTVTNAAAEISAISTNVSLCHTRVAVKCKFALKTNFPGYTWPERRDADRSDKRDSRRVLVVARSEKRPLNVPTVGAHGYHPDTRRQLIPVRLCARTACPFSNRSSTAIIGGVATGEKAILS